LQPAKKPPGQTDTQTRTGRGQALDITAGRVLLLYDDLAQAIVTPKGRPGPQQTKGVTQATQAAQHASNGNNPAHGHR
jgi:hypothetical protein